MNEDVQSTGFYRSMGLLAGLYAATAVLMPFLSGFFSLTPPFFRSIGWMLGLFSILAGLIIFNISALDRNTNTLQTARWRKSMWLLFSFATLLIFYIALLAWTTSPNPQDADRFQIGFGKEPWSLTDNLGKSLLSDYPDKTPMQWLMMTARFTEDGPQGIWEPWSVRTAGCLLVAVYLLMFLAFLATWVSVARAFFEGHNATGRKLQ